MNRMPTLAAVALAALLSWPGMGRAGGPGEVVEWGLYGGVNWTHGKVRAEGTGGVAQQPGSSRRVSGAMACRAAVVDGQRNLLEILNGVRVEGETVVEELTLKSDTIKTAVSGVLRGFSIVDRQPYPDDGSCVVTLEVPMSGALAASIYAHTAQPLPASTSLWQPDFSQLWSGLTGWIITPALAAPQGVPPWQAQFHDLLQRLERLEQVVHAQGAAAAAGGPAAAGEYSGLVIDARGSNFIPSLSPKIRRVRSDILYPSDHQDASRREGQLVSLFMNDLILAQNHPKVGNHPVVIKALRTWGKYRTELVLGNEGSDKLDELLNKGFLDHAGVIIVLD